MRLLVAFILGLPLAAWSEDWRTETAVAEAASWQRRADETKNRKLKAAQISMKMLIDNQIAAALKLKDCAALRAVEPTLSSGTYVVYPSGHLDDATHVRCVVSKSAAVTQVIRKMKKPCVVTKTCAPVRATSIALSPTRDFNHAIGAADRSKPVWSIGEKERGVFAESADYPLMLSSMYVAAFRFSAARGAGVPGEHKVIQYQVFDSRSGQQLCGGKFRAADLKAEMTEVAGACRFDLTTIKNPRLRFRATAYGRGKIHFRGLTVEQDVMALLRKRVQENR